MIEVQAHGPLFAVTCDHHGRVVICDNPAIAAFNAIGHATTFHRPAPAPRRPDP